MAGARLLGEEGFRGDGRKPNEIRHISGKMGVLKQAHGSAYLEQGDTKILAAVYGPHGVKSGKGKTLHDQAIINCQYSMAVFSTSERKLRPRGDRKSIEVNQNLKQIFESAILVNLYPSQQIDIYIEVLQADGSAMAASVNAATLALADAGIALKGLVCASSSGSVDDMPIIDLNHNEESQSTFQLNMAMLPGVYDQIFMYHLNGRLHESHFDRATENTTKGCKQVLKAMERIISENVTN